MDPLLDHPTAASPWFDNPILGQRTRLITLPSETGGRFAVIDYEFAPWRGKFAVPEHFHPSAEEQFEVLGGTAEYAIGGTLGRAEAGETIVMPAGVPHLHPYSASHEPLLLRQTIRPLTPDERGLTASIQGAITILGLARDGKVDASGRPAILQLAVILRASMPTTYMAGLPVVVQRLVLTALGVLASATGYQLAYPRYGVVSPSGFIMPEPG